MGYHAHIENDFMSMRYRAFVWQRVSGTHLQILSPTGSRIIDNPEGAVIPEAERTTLFDLPTDAAPVLLAALARQLGAVEHPEQLRRDYEAERRRVDQFIAHLTEKRS